MCSKRDIDAALEQLETCHDHEAKKRILEQLDCCKTCQERLTEGEAFCRCESRHIEFLNLIEHIKQHRPFAKSSE